MPSPSQPFAKQSGATTPCDCCRVVPHEFYPERDLDAYVCRDCGVKLEIARVRLSYAGIVGCVQVKR